MFHSALGYGSRWKSLQACHLEGLAICDRDATVLESRQSQGSRVSLANLESAGGEAQRETLCVPGGVTRFRASGVAHRDSQATMYLLLQPNAVLEIERLTRAIGSRMKGEDTRGPADIFRVPGEVVDQLGCSRPMTTSNFFSLISSPNTSRGVCRRMASAMNADGRKQGIFCCLTICIGKSSSMYSNR